MNSRYFHFATRARAIVAIAALITTGLGSSLLADKGKDALDAEARFSAAIAHLRDGRLDMAVEEFQKAVKDDPKNPYFRKGLGLAYAQKGQLALAIAEFRKAIEINPYFVDVKNDLGATLLRAGKRDEGKKLFFEIFSDPTNPTPEMTAYNLGLAYAEEKDSKEAIRWFETAVARNAEYAEAYVDLANQLVAANRIDEAAAQLEIAVRRCPRNANVLLAHGQVLYRAGRFVDARKALEAAVRLDGTGAVGRTASDLLAKFPK